MSIVNPTNSTSYITYSPPAGTDKPEGDNTNEEVFSQLLAQALNELTNSSYNALNGNLTGTDSMGMSGFFMPMQDIMMQSATSNLEQAMQKASSTRDNNDAMIALLMLMMIMQSSEGGGGDMSLMMPMMASIIGQLDDKDSLRNDFMYTSYNSGTSPYVLDTIDTEVFQNTIPAVSGSSEAVLPLEWWRPTVPAVVNTMYDRDPRAYREVIDQFEVETAERYRPGREGNTYCNVYVWDVTRAMGAEIPYYSDPATGAPREYPDIQGANYNRAVSMDNWLKTYGGQYGWREVSAEDAQMHANQGKPAVASGGDVGHISMIAPSESGGFDPVRGVVVAQAGRTVTNYMHISGIYSAAALKDKVTYWVHD